MVTKKILCTVLLASGLFGAFQVTAMGMGGDYLRNLEEKLKKEIAIPKYRSEIATVEEQYKTWLAKQGGSMEVDPEANAIKHSDMWKKVQHYEQLIQEAEQRIKELNKLMV